MSPRVLISVCQKRKKDDGGNVVVDGGACEFLLAKLRGGIHLFYLHFIG